MANVLNQSTQSIIRPVQRPILGVVAQSIVLPRNLELPSGGGLLENVVGWWGLDDAANGARLDLHGSLDFTDVSSGVGQAAGKKGNASSTSGGTSHHLSLSYAAAPQLAPGDIDYSLSMWLWFDALTAATGIFGNTNLSTQGHMLWVEDGTNVFWRVGGFPGTGVSFAPSLSTWYHVVLTHDSVANEIAMIINDGTPTTAAHSTGFNSGVTLPFMLHRYSNAANSFAGRIDNFVTFEKVLPPAQITTLYGGGDGYDYPG